MDVRFEIPARCADLLRSGEVDIGLVPVIELERQPLEILPGLGIASRGEVLSILLISKVPVSEIRTLALDASSRTSVVLTQMVLAEKYGVRPRTVTAAPDIEAMLRTADAGLVIGDPALRVDREVPDRVVLDLGAEWTDWTGLPMVYAVWAARAGFDWRPASEALRESWEYGRDRIDQIASAEHARRGISRELARDYLTRNIHFEIGPEYALGLARYRELARNAGLV